MSSPAVAAAKRDLAEEMVTLMLPFYRKWIKLSDPHTLQSMYLKKARARMVLQVSSSVIVERLGSEPTVTSVGEEIGYRISLNLAGSKSARRRLRQLSISAGGRVAHAVCRKTIRGMWDAGTIARVGTLMVHWVQKHSGIFVFDREFLGKGVKRRMLMRASPEYEPLIALSQNAHEEKSRLRRPQSSPHSDWDSEMQGMVTRRHFTGIEMPNVFSAVNSLQRIAWELDQDQVDYFRDCFERGMPAPEIPGGDKPVLRRGSSKQDWARFHEANAVWLTKRRSAARVAAATVLMPDPIYFRWFLDFRGRMLSLGGGKIHPQTGDLPRSMLRFHHGERIGDAGLHLARHGANLFGLSKATYREKEDWVRENTDFICRAASEPGGERIWWRAADPWRFLAFCREWSGFIANGRDHITKIPCMIDATSCALQLAALTTRDPDLAAKVNVIGGDRPHDIYSDVAARVTAAAKLHPYGREWLELLGGEVLREAVKDPCLATIFGGSPYFASLQAVQRWFWTQNFPFPFGGSVVAPCRWLACCASEKLLEVAPGFLSLRKFLIQIGTVQPDLVWRSPSGMLVDARCPKFQTINANDYTVSVQTDDWIDKRKVRRSIFSNFITSLEASILVDVINRSPFEVTSTHDCFGALAPHMEELGDSVRAAYFEVFSADPLQDFLRQIGLPDESLATGDLDLRCILQAEYLAC